ncbi:hypothetical protein Hanom_Chr09g00780911 [Helianthus anomalus]
MYALVITILIFLNYLLLNHIKLIISDKKKLLNLQTYSYVDMHMNPVHINMQIF